MNKLNEVDLDEIEQQINEDIAREILHAGWMASVLIKLPDQKGYKGLPESIREEIERIRAAVE
jgi:hypothetical protein